MPAVGEDHQAAVAVQVDEAGRDDLARGVDRARRRAPGGAASGARIRSRSPSTTDRSDATGRAGAVDDRPAADEQVDAVRHPTTLADRSPAVSPAARRACATKASSLIRARRGVELRPWTRPRLDRRPGTPSRGSRRRPRCPRPGRRPPRASALATSSRTARLTRRWAASTSAGPTQAFDPVDDAGQRAAGPQEVARVEVAMDEHGRTASAGPWSSGATARSQSRGVAPPAGTSQIATLVIAVVRPAGHGTGRHRMDGLEEVDDRRRIGDGRDRANRPAASSGARRAPVPRPR